MVRPDWQTAAAAAWEAIQVAEANGVIILPLKDASNNDRHLNYYDRTICEESIWTRNYGKPDLELGRRQRSRSQPCGEAISWHTPQLPG